jgi:hypothetical protein
MWLDGLLSVSHFQSGGHTVSYEQARAYLDEMLAQPYNAELAEHFQERSPAWAKALKKS